MLFRSVLAVDLCILLKNSLSQIEIDKILYLAWVESEIIRDSAYKFIVQAFFHNSLLEETGDIFEQGKKINIEKTLVALVNFFKDHGKQLFKIDYFVQGLWNKISAIRSFDSISNLLLKENFANLLENDKIILANFLISGTKYAAGLKDNV